MAQKDLAKSPPISDIFGKHFLKGIGATKIRNSPEEVSVSAQFPEPQAKATPGSLSARPPENTPDFEQWDQDTTPPVAASPAKGEEYLLLAVERFGDRIDLIEHMIGQYIEDLSTLSRAENTIDPPAEEGSATSELLRKVDQIEERIGAQLKVLSDKIQAQPTSNADRLADKLQLQLDELTAQLDAFASRPMIRPDMSDQHKRTAQILTAISTISRRQEAVMGQIEERLAAFTLEQKGILLQNENIAASASQIQQQTDTRLQAIETMLGTLISEGQKNNKKLASFSRTTTVNAKKLRDKLDSLDPTVNFDGTALETRLCNMINQTLVKPRHEVADTDAQTSLAAELLRNLRFAVAEILAGAGQHYSLSTPDCEPNPTLASRNDPSPPSGI